jgi:hypothetical protein
VLGGGGVDGGNGGGKGEWYELGMQVVADGSKLSALGSVQPTIVLGYAHCA